MLVGLDLVLLVGLGLVGWFGLGSVWLYLVGWLVKSMADMVLLGIYVDQWRFFSPSKAHGQLRRYPTTAQSDGAFRAQMTNEW